MKSEVPSISITLLEERKKREETKKLLFDTLVQDQAAQMHLQLLRSIEEINELSLFLGFSLQYSIREEDRNLVRSGRESGQMFIQRRKLSTGNELKHENKKKRSNDHGCRMYTMSEFLRQLEQLKIDASKVRSILPTAATAIVKKGRKPYNVEDEKNSDRDRNESESCHITAFRICEDEHVIPTEDFLNGAQSSNSRLLTSLLDKNNLYSSMTEKTKQKYEEFDEVPENHDHSNKTAGSIRSFITQPSVKNIAMQRTIENQQKIVLDSTVALTKQVEAQRAEVYRRGWNLL
jgi:hypothetical protein